MIILVEKEVFEKIAKGGKAKKLDNFVGGYDYVMSPNVSESEVAMFSGMADSGKDVISVYSSGVGRFLVNQFVLTFDAYKNGKTDKVSIMQSELDDELHLETYQKIVDKMVSEGGYENAMLINSLQLKVFDEKAPLPVMRNGI